MARVYTDGAEMSDATFFDSGGALVSNINPVPYASDYYYYVSSGLVSGKEARKNITAISECYARVRGWTSNLANSMFIMFISGTTYLGFLGVESGTNYFTAYGMNSASRSGTATILEASTLTAQAQQWYLFEVYYKLADVGGRFVVYVDGTKIIDFTGDTKLGTASTFNGIAYGVRGTGVMAFDDLALNDTAGGADNSWCGDGVIVKMTPDEDGAHNNWHGSDSDDLDNYLLVDEYPQDGDTTYVYRDGADSGTQDQYSLSDLDWTNKTILRIYPEARIKKTSAAAYTVKLGILPSGGADDMSAARTLLTDAYIRVIGDEYTVNPVDSNPWEEADLDALEFIAEVG